MQDYPFLTQALARTIKRLREDAGLSKRKLAERSGIDRVYLLQVEQAKYRPTMNFVFLLSRALRIQPSKVVAMIEKEQKAMQKEESEAASSSTS